MKRSFKFFVCVSLLLILFVVCNVNYDQIFSLPEDFVVSYDDVKDININKRFGGVVNATLKKEVEDVASVESNNGVITFKIFGFIPIRKVVVKMAPEEDFYIGGVPVGISIISDGLIFLESENPNVDILKQGDIITSVNGEKVSTFNDLQEVLNQADDEEVKIEYKRKNKLHKGIIKCERNDLGNLKLGIIAKNNVTGVGTLTYIDSKDSFGALGHCISEEENKIDVLSGEIYQCSQIGVVKGKVNDPGQLRCVFIQENEKGIIKENNNYGIFGDIVNKEGLVDENLKAKVGGRLSVVPGKAKLVSSVSGIREEYDIEIIKASFQNKADDKSLVIRVTDQRLLDLTGGIVQGMSGSPIMQNGKIVGAVTHVFINDPTKGYGVYIDWMLK